MEGEWKSWAKAVKLRRKLWTMAHAKCQDGEGIGIARTNPHLKHAVKLDIALIETEQCQTPMLPFGVPGYIDGIRFDEFGNPVWYDILPQHPGGQWSALNQQPERVPARFVFHWFQLRRPGQHRGIPEYRSTLNVGAGARRWREATIAAAETAAEFTLFLKTQQNANSEEPAEVDAMSTLEITKRMMTALPEGWDPFQMKAEQPSGTCAEFNRGAVADIASRSSAARDAFSAFRHRCSSGCASKQVAALSPRQSQHARPKSCRLELLFLRQTRFIGGLGRGFSVALRLRMPLRLNFCSKCATKSDQGIAPVERMVKFGVCCLIGARKRNRVAVILTIT